MLFVIWKVFQARLTGVVWKTGNFILLLSFVQGFLLTSFESQVILGHQGRTTMLEHVELDFWACINIVLMLLRSRRILYDLYTISSVHCIFICIIQRKKEIILDCYLQVVEFMTEIAFAYIFWVFFICCCCNQQKWFKR